MDFLPRARIPGNSTAPPGPDRVGEGEPSERWAQPGSSGSKRWAAWPGLSQAVPLPGRPCCLRDAQEGSSGQLLAPGARHTWGFGGPLRAFPGASLLQQVLSVALARPESAAPMMRSSWGPGPSSTPVGDADLERCQVEALWCPGRRRKALLPAPGRSPPLPWLASRARAPGGASVKPGSCFQRLCLQTKWSVPPGGHGEPLAFRANFLLLILIWGYFSFDF